MPNFILRDANELDFKAIVSLNALEVQHTSPMDEARLRHLDSLASYHKVIIKDGQVTAFLLAMQNGCGYASENFVWFAGQFQTFLYIDRIIVSSAYQRQGLGSQLYADLFGYAQTNNIPIIACEYNIVPPNKISGRFHHNFGFKEVGRQWLGHGAKQVSLQIAKIP